MVRPLCGVLIAGGVWMGAGLTAQTAAAQAQAAQAQACGASGYRVVASRWDPVLWVNWEMRQDCAHPAWPARVVSGVGAFNPAAHDSATAAGGKEIEVVRPVLVRAGDPVRLWMQDATVRIEMSGVAEEPARLGERTTVRIARLDEDGGLTVERMGGIVRGAGDVEMER